MNGKEGIQALIDAKRGEFPHHPDPDPADILGVLVAQWAEWDGRQIVEVFLAALEDANYHTLGGEIEKLVELRKEAGLEL